MIFGTGELYLDCVMHDLRKMYSEIGKNTWCVKIGISADVLFIFVYNIVVPIDLLIINIFYCKTTIFSLLYLLQAI